MRRSIFVLCTFFAAACGVFGPDGSSSDDSDATPHTPEENATPPLGGHPVDGVFVSTSRGKDEGTGSDQNPVRTLQQAMTLAKQRGQRVIACAEDYAEDVVLVDGVSMYGYFDCTSDWAETERHATVRAKASPAVSASGISTTTRVEGFDVYAPDFGGDAPSDKPRTSIGLDVRSSSSLTFAKVAIHAGTGGPGIDGVEGPVNVEAGTPNGHAGTPRVATDNCPFASGCGGTNKYVAGPVGGASKCAYGPAGGPGGAGGDSTFYNACTKNSNAALDTHGRFRSATPSTALGGHGYCFARSQPIPLTPFGYGDNGSAGAAGNDGANGVWSIGRDGFTVGNGTKGADGSPGQGGGGGGGEEVYPRASTCDDTCDNPAFSYYWTATGGSGGAGGCGGIAGTPGTGGGASIGVVLIDSRGIAIKQATIASAKGGHGGRGALGSNGLPGGASGPQGTPQYAGPGGAGGSGGTSGLSGHGAPGPSIAIAYQGARPDLEGTNLVPGEGGDGQPELRKGNKLLPATKGESKAEASF